MTRWQILILLLGLALIAAQFAWHTPESWLDWGGTYTPRNELILRSEP